MSVRLLAEHDCAAIVHQFGSARIARFLGAEADGCTAVAGSALESPEDSHHGDLVRIGVISDDSKLSVITRSVFHACSMVILRAASEGSWIYPWMVVQDTSNGTSALT